MRYSEFFPEQARKIIAILKKSGFKAYFVGGCVRDYHMGRDAYDFDITTDASSDEIINALGEAGIAASLTGGNCGTVKAYCNELEFEITPHRTEGGYSDHRHPSQVSFVKDIKSDLVRRDFTVNAMALTENEGKEELTDLFCGMEDLSKKCLRCVGDAEIRFEEDALRILRALRFSAQLGFEIEEKTALAMKKKAKLLSCVSGERKASELRKTLKKGLPQGLLLEFPEVFSEILGNFSGNFSDFKKGGFCEVLFYLKKDSTFEELEKTVLSLKLTSSEKECIYAYKRIYDEMSIGEELPMLVIRYGAHLERYSEIFADESIAEFYRDEKLPKSLQELNIGGEELKSAGFSGADIRRAQEMLFCAVVQNKVQNENTRLLAYVKKLGKDILK